MTYCDNFKINGVPLLAPDADVELTCTDVDASDSGRDESGVMHRQVVRRRVRAWTFTYSFLTREEYAYMEYLLSLGDTFPFRFVDDAGVVQECTAYCSNESLTVRDLRRGLYRNYKFSIIEC